MSSELKDEFQTIAAPSEGSFMDKGSKFIAMAFPVSSEEEAHNLLVPIKKSHFKARHFCTAIRLGPTATLERSSDDGEPSGSAGRPILGQLIKHNLTDIFVVVVRYFGGTKLGIPGLIEAYKESTAEAIMNAEVVKKTVYSSFLATMAYERFPSFKNMILDNNLPIWDEWFNDQASLSFGLRQGTADVQLRSLLREFSQRDFDMLENYETYLEIKFVKSNQLLIR